MKKLVLVALAGLLLAGCETASDRMRDGADGPDTFRYMCRGVPLVVTVDQPLAQARVLIDGRVRVLPQVMAASGAKYDDGTYVFWSKGDRATVSRSNIIILDDCELQ